MKLLRPGTDPEGFLRGLHTAPARALLLDYDGTLAPFREERDRAVPYPGVRGELTRILRARHTRLVIVSGRWTRDLLPLLDLEEVPEIWGSHGWERLRPDGTLEIGEMDAAALGGLDAAHEWAVTEGVEFRAETKPGCLALHLRGLEPAAGEELRGLALARFRPLARRTGLELHAFDGGIELRAPGRSKADAVRTVINELPRGAAMAYLGDDRTDEDAFRSLSGGGLSVLVRSELRPTAADLWLRPPEELLDFLRRWRTEAGRTGTLEGREKAAPEQEPELKGDR